MPIEVTTPVTQTINATSWWIQSIQISAPAPTAQASARVTAIPYDPNTGQLAAVKPTMFMISDLFGQASVDATTGATTAAAITALLAALSAIMVQKGLAQ